MIPSLIVTAVRRLLSAEVIVSVYATDNSDPALRIGRRNKKCLEESSMRIGLRGSSDTYDIGKMLPSHLPTHDNLR